MEGSISCSGKDRLCVVVCGTREDPCVCDSSKKDMLATDPTVAMIARIRIWSMFLRDECAVQSRRNPRRTGRYKFSEASESNRE